MMFLPVVLRWFFVLSLAVRAGVDAASSSTTGTYGGLLTLLESSATIQIQVEPAVFKFDANVTIGSGQNVVINGIAGSSVFDGRDSNRLFVVKDGAELTLRGLVLKNGWAAQFDSGGQGGALLILNGAYVELANCRVTGNHADDNGGGAYLFESKMAVSDGSSIDGNTANRDGGGAYLRSSTMTVSDGSSIKYNSAPYGNGGGAYIHEDSTMTVSDGSSITDNSAYVNGGGAYLYSDSMMTVAGGSSITGNSVLTNPQYFRAASHVNAF